MATGARCCYIPILYLVLNRVAADQENVLHPTGCGTRRVVGVKLEGKPSILGRGTPALWCDRSDHILCNVQEHFEALDILTTVGEKIVALTAQRQPTRVSCAAAVEAGLARKTAGTATTTLARRTADTIATRLARRTAHPITALARRTAKAAAGRFDATRLAQGTAHAIAALARARRTANASPGRADAKRLPCRAAHAIKTLAGGTAHAIATTLARRAAKAAATFGTGGTADPKATGLT